jgi:hypothetical protein
VALAAVPTKQVLESIAFLEPVKKINEEGTQKQVLEFSQVAHLSWYQLPRR